MSGTSDGFSAMNVMACAPEVPAAEVVRGGDTVAGLTYAWKGDEEIQEKHGTGR